MTIGKPVYHAFDRNLTGEGHVGGHPRGVLCPEPGRHGVDDRRTLGRRAPRLRPCPLAQPALLLGDRRSVGGRGRGHGPEPTGRAVSDRPASPGTHPVSSLDVPSPIVIVHTALTVLSAFVATFLASAAVWAVAVVRPQSTLIQRIIVAWSRAWLVPAGVDLQVVGEEHVDPTTSYVVVANHRSNIDVMVCFAALPIPIRYLAKAELFRIPVFAQAMRAIGIVEVDRKHRRELSIIETVNRQADQVIARGHSLIIYPEGTRSRDGSPRPFKKGAFTMAVASGMPVLPVTLHGTRDVWAPHRFWIHPGRVTVVIDPPIDTSGLDRSDVEALRQRVEAQINGHLDRIDDIPDVDRR